MEKCRGGGAANTPAHSRLVLCSQQWFTSLFNQTFLFAWRLKVNNHPNIVDTEVRGHHGELLCRLLSCCLTAFEKMLAEMWESFFWGDLGDLALEWSISEQEWTCKRPLERLAFHVNIWKDTKQGKASKNGERAFWGIKKVCFHF